MFKFILFGCFASALSVLGQKNQQKLLFSHEAIDAKTYTVYVENPTEQLRSFNLTIEGDNFKFNKKKLQADTISPGTKRKLFTLKKGKKPTDIVVNYKWLELVGNLYKKETLGHKYQLPYAKGEKFTVAKGFDKKTASKEKTTIVFTMPQGTAVHAMRSGQIFDMKLDGNNACMEEKCEKFSNYIKIVHYDGTVSVYKNLMTNGSNKKIGDFVNVGQRIARSGFTGKCNEPSLQVEVQVLKTDLSGYESKPFNCYINSDGKSDILKEGNEYTRFL